MRIDGAQWVVQQQDVGIGVNRARQGDALLLPAGEVHALLADLRGVALRQSLEVGPQLASADDLGVPLLVQRAVESDVVLDRRVADPRDLRGIGDAPGDGDAAGARGRAKVADQRLQQAGLAHADAAEDHGEVGPGLRGRRGGHGEADAAEERHAAWPVELGVREPDRHTRLGRRPLDRGHQGPALDLRRSQEVLDALERHVGLDGRRHHVREHREREAQDAEQRQGGERRLRLQLVAQRGVH
mmetsp:Transcript_12330/g.36629  ORF Transcript_12330/g.36629 Transcript_12330/m.36629 type:complete len:243 (+) Transcript_12330:2135-2863(+)